MIDCRGDFKQRSNQNNFHTLWNFRRACEIKEKFRMGCEISHTLQTNFAHPVKIKAPCEIISITVRNFRKPWENFRRPNTISHIVRKPKGSAKSFRTPKSFRTLCETQEAHAKPKSRLPFFFKPPPTPSFFISSFCKHQTLCESFIFLCHLATLPLSIRFRAPCASHFEETHSVPPQSTDPQSPSCPFSETHHEAESLLSSGT